MIAFLMAIASRVSLAFSARFAVESRGAQLFASRGVLDIAGQLMMHRGDDDDA